MKITIEPQYVRLTQSQGKFGTGEMRYLHEVQRQFKENFDQMPTFNIITAPTGTGKSYAFPFPALQSKASGAKYPYKGLIILPTNALIDELHTNFSNTFAGELSIAKLTKKALDNQLIWNEEDDESETLDVVELRGFKRWQKILEVIKEADLVITNPDILMYAMYGGYHQLLNFQRKYADKVKKYSTGRSEFVDFINSFDYVVIDEYHLYDEEQLANILMIPKTADMLLQINHFVKYFFVSATPEEGLKQFWEQTNTPYNEIIEQIVPEADHARAIHGTLEVEFYSNGTMPIKILINNKLEEIKSQIEQGIRVLIILDTLREVQAQADELAIKLPNIRIYTSTGYIDKNDKKEAENLKNAQLILATNKAEVGVNYDVEYCIMQTGRYYQNFVQRFGRVSRGNKRGKIIISVENVLLGAIAKKIGDNTVLQYYNFMNIMQEALQGKDFYTQRLPRYMGAYAWVNWYQMYRYQEYNTAMLFKQRVESELLEKIPATKHLFCVMNSINAAFGNDVKVYSNLGKLKTWWLEFIDTYLHFRDSSMVVRIVDTWLNKEVDYSLEWILQHREILKIEAVERGKKHTYWEYTYYVGRLKEQDKSLQYEVTTIPSLGSMKECFLAYQAVNLAPKLQETFENAVEECEKILKRGYGEERTILLKILADMRHLKLVFTRKRLTIKNIRIDDCFL